MPLHSTTCWWPRKRTSAALLCVRFSRPHTARRWLRASQARSSSVCPRSTASSATRKSPSRLPPGPARDLSRHTTSPVLSAKLVKALAPNPGVLARVSQKKTISIITPCYNEEANVLNLYNQVRAVMAGIGRYEYEHIFIDNHSRDNTVAILRMIAAEDPNVKIIVNARNFGHIRSPIHALMQARGDAILGIVADLQDPPPMIADMIAEWEKGAYCVLGIKRSSEEPGLMFWLRKQYYKYAERLSSIETIQNYTGFGLYDRKVVELVRQFDDPYPYFRGMIAEIGLPTVKLLYDQPARKFGVTKNNWYTLYDIGMLGVINYSKVPLRMATFAGFGGALLSFLIAFGYLVAKLAFWNTFSVGVAPMIIGLFFLQSLMLVFLGVMGEYVGAIYTQIQHRPYAVELERINFDQPFSYPRQEPVMLAGLTAGNPLTMPAPGADAPPSPS